MKNKLIIIWCVFQIFFPAFGAAIDNEISPLTLKLNNTLHSKSEALESFKEALENYDFKITTRYLYNDKGVKVYDLAIDRKDKKSFLIEPSSQINLPQFNEISTPLEIIEKTKKTVAVKKRDVFSPIATYEDAKLNGNLLLNRVERKKPQFQSKSWNDYSYNKKNGEFFIFKQHWLHRITNSKRK